MTSTKPGIDRKAVVERHIVRIDKPDAANPLTVGNGDFAFTADITGMQTFSTFHDPVNAMESGRSATNTATQSTWGWHSMPNPHGYVLQDAMTRYETARGPVEYPDKFTMDIPIGGEIPDEFKAGTWLHVNPQRLDLGRIGLALRATPDAEPETDPSVLSNITQQLDLWRGVIETSFEYLGETISVTTVADPDSSGVSFRVSSALLETGQLTVAFRFPYASDSFFATADWLGADRHSTEISRSLPHGASITRVLDDTSYALDLAWTSAAELSQKDAHHLELRSEGPLLELSARFHPEGGTPPRSFREVLEAAEAAWEQFWQSGAAVDFSGSTDSRAAELERRVVLSQYLTRVNCAGVMPPQETGLTTNSWQGKFHLEMHWWHAAHFTAWGRPELLERSLPWYQSILDAARATARRQNYEGARWPKQVGPEGRESPTDIGALLIWQQPHLLSLLEMVHRAREHAGAEAQRELVERYAELVEETALFMASFVDEVDGVFHLPAPVMPAQEFYDARTTSDPTFELAYWWWGLEVAQSWRERLGKKRNPRWQAIQNGLASPTVIDGHYAAIATEPYLRRDDHPSMLCALGVVPPTPVIDPGIMEATLESVLDDWDWDSAWGWDFAVMAMTATRVGRRDLAVDALLKDAAKNSYSAVGHNVQRAENNPMMASILPIYLPGNGGLLAAVSMMLGEAEGVRGPVGFPDDGTWTVQHEGFIAWP